MRLENLVERNPRRCGKYALRLLQQPAALQDKAAFLMLAYALLRWEKLDDAAYALGMVQLPADDRLAKLFHRRLELMLRQLDGEGPGLQNDWEAHAQDCAANAAMRELARARCEQIAHLNLLGRQAEAYARAEKYQELIQSHGLPSDQARYAYVLGVAAIGVARLDIAQQQLDLAYRRFAHLQHPAEQARVCFERAWLYLLREQLDQAEANLQTAQRSYLRLHLPYRIALCQRDLGIVARYRGNYGIAMHLLIDAQKQFLELKRDYHAASCNFSIGSIAYMTGLLDLAMTMYQQAQLYYEQHHDQLHACVALRNQIMILADQGHYVQALHYGHELAQRHELLRDRLAMAELHSIRAKALYGLGQASEAYAELELARSIFLELDNQAAAAECSLDQADFLIQSKQYEQAQTMLEHVTALDNRPAHYWRVCYGMGTIQQALGNFSSALDYYLQAIAIVKKLRTQLLSEHASSQIFLMARQLYQDALQLAVEQNQAELVLQLAEQQHALVFDQQLKLARSGLASPQAEHSRAAESLKAAVSNPQNPDMLKQALTSYLDRLIRQRHRSLIRPSGSTIPAEKELQIDQVRQGLQQCYGNNWSILYPIFLADQLILATITPDRMLIEQRTLAQSERELIGRACQPSMRLHLYRDLERLQDSTLPAWHSLQRLADMLLPGWLHKCLNPEHRLLIVPSGTLHMLPWAALRLDNTWLCERAIIQLSPSLNRATSLIPINLSAAALLLACSNFHGRAPDLPAAQHSLELVSTIWQGETDCLCEEQASRQSMYELNYQATLQDYELIHIASHAQLGAADGLMAHIKLADSDLLLDDILQLRLKAQLLVLAACEGGAGRVLPGDEVLGLSRALLITGARAVLANIWPIHDRSTLAILSAFYQGLAEGLDAAAALASAQRLLLSHSSNDEDAILKSPLVWAGFTLMTCGGEE